MGQRVWPVVSFTEHDLSQLMKHDPFHVTEYDISWVTDVTCRELWSMTYREVWIMIKPNNPNRNPNLLIIQSTVVLRRVVEFTSTSRPIP